MRKLLVSAAVAILAVTVASCHKPNAGPDASSSKKAGKPTGFTANYPLQYFAQRIAALQDSDLIILNGATFSKWADKVTLPEARVVDTAAAFRDKFIIVKNAVTHSHGKQGEHSHDGTSFTTWIDFQQAILHATAVL